MTIVALCRWSVHVALQQTQKQKAQLEIISTQRELQEQILRLSSARLSSRKERGRARLCFLRLCWPSSAAASSSREDACCFHLSASCRLWSITACQEKQYWSRSVCWCSLQYSSLHVAFLFQSKRQTFMLRETFQCCPQHTSSLFSLTPVDRETQCLISGSAERKRKKVRRS